MIFWVSRKPSKPGMPSKPGHLLTKPGHPLTKAGLPLTKPKAPLPKTLRMAMARAMARATAATAKARVGTPEATRAATNTTLTTNMDPASGTNQAQGNEPGRQLGRIPAWLPPWIQSTGCNFKTPLLLSALSGWRLQGGRRRAVHPQLRLGLLRQVPDMSLVFYWNRFYCVRQNPF